MKEAGVYLLFAPGKRPDRHAFHKFAAARSDVAISHDPSEAQKSEGNSPDMLSKPATEALAENGWLELLSDGLTFDLRGLSPGHGVSIPEIRHYFDFPEDAEIGAADALVLVPGPHLEGSQNVLPVMRGLMALVCKLLQNFEAIRGVVWPPSFAAIGRRYLESTVSAWLDGGPFPALGLTAFTETTDGAVQSVGLSHLIDCELRIEPPLSHDKIAATRLGVRLVNQLILMRGIEGEEQVVAPDGSKLTLRQSDNRRFIRVWAD